MSERWRSEISERALARSLDSAARRSVARVKDGALVGDVLVPGERWVDAWRAELAALDEGERAHWESLLRVASRAAAPRATPEWRAAASLAAQAVGVDALRAAARAATVRLAGTDRTPRDASAERAHVEDANATVLRGLVWLLMLDPWPGLPWLLGELLTTCMTTVEGTGPRAQKVANACIASLGALATSADAELQKGAVAQLVQARESIHDRATRVAISTAIGSAAAALGLAARELEALGALDCGPTDGAHDRPR